VEIKDKQDTRDDDVPGDVLKLLGEEGLKIMTTVEYHICNWRVAQGFQESYNDCLKEAKSYKMQRTSHIQQR
jgi:hypothetical protein